MGEEINIGSLAVIEIMRNIFDTVNIEEMLEKYITLMSNLVKADSAILASWQSELGYFSHVNNLPDDNLVMGTIILPDDGGLHGRLYRENKNQVGSAVIVPKIIYLSNYEKNMDALDALKKYHFSFAFGCPIFVRTELVATLVFYFNARKEKIQPFEYEILTEVSKCGSLVLLNHQIHNEKTELQSELTKSEVLLALMVNSSQNLIINLDMSGKIKNYNKIAENILGYSAGEMENNKLPLEPGQNEENFNITLLKVRKGEVLVGEFKFYTKEYPDSNFTSIKVNLIPIKDEKGIIHSLLLVGQDISEKKKLKKQVDRFNVEIMQKDQALINSQQKLEVIKEQKKNAEKIALIGELASRLSHNINNPLMTIITNLSIIGDEIEYSQLDGDTPLPIEDIRGSIKNINFAGTKIQNTLRELRRFSEITKDDSHFRMNNFVDVIYQTLNEMKPEFDENKIKIVEKNAIKNSKTCLVMSNFLGLRIVFKSVLSNSVVAILNNPKKSNSGIISINISTIKETSGDYYRVSIKDNGCGMSQEDIEDIFTPFSSNWDTKEQLRTQHIGMSLATSKSILDLWSPPGKISVKSKIGVGSVFNIEFLIQD